MQSRGIKSSSTIDGTANFSELYAGTSVNKDGLILSNLLHTSAALRHPQVWGLRPTPRPALAGSAPHPAAGLRQAVLGWWPWASCAGPPLHLSPAWVTGTHLGLGCAAY